MLPAPVFPAPVFPAAAVDILALTHRTFLHTSNYYMTEAKRGWSWPPDKFSQRFPGNVTNLTSRMHNLRRCYSAPDAPRSSEGGPRRIPPRLPPGTIAEFGGISVFGVTPAVVASIQYEQPDSSGSEAGDGGSAAQEPAIGGSEPADGGSGAEAEGAGAQSLVSDEPWQSLPAAAQEDKDMDQFSETQSSLCSSFQVEPPSFSGSFPMADPSLVSAGSFQVAAPSVVSDGSWQMAAPSLVSEGSFQVCDPPQAPAAQEATTQSQRIPHRPHPQAQLRPVRQQKCL